MASIDLQNVQVKNGSTWYKCCPFPVGFVYLSSNNTSPASTYGGTWSAINENRYLRTGGAWNTGGSDTISYDQMPVHDHYYHLTIQSYDEGGGVNYRTVGANAGYRTQYNTDSAGGGKAFYPSYRNVYAWYRTA